MRSLPLLAFLLLLASGLVAPSSAAVWMPPEPELASARFQESATPRDLEDCPGDPHPVWEFRLPEPGNVSDRRIRRDPAGMVDGPNRYGWAGNNPLRNLDRNGLDFEPYGDVTLDVADRLAETDVGRRLIDAHRNRPDVATVYADDEAFLDSSGRFVPRIDSVEVDLVIADTPGQIGRQERPVSARERITRGHIDRDPPTTRDWVDPETGAMRPMRCIDTTISLSLPSVERFREENRHPLRDRVPNERLPDLNSLEPRDELAAVMGHELADALSPTGSENDRAPGFRESIEVELEIYEQLRRIRFRERLRERMRGGQ